MNIYYELSPYQSHRRVGNVYRDSLGQQHRLVNKVEDAAVVILHLEPHNYGKIYETYPCLATKYVIAYCVWEASHLPNTYVASIKMVQEVWTCSEYCLDIFAREHRKVTYIPHVIERSTGCTENDMSTVRQLIGYDPTLMYFLCITKLWDKRKNTKCLSRVFETLSAELPNARLIIKSSGDYIPPENAPSNIIYVSKHITEGQLNALFRLSDAYVSAHHSEGWGLSMSDAMLFGIPVIATAYSGNLEFMNEANSFLVKAQETHIAESDCFGKFDHTMRWAEPDREELRKAITFVATHYDGPLVRGRVVQAKRSIEQFNRACVSGMMFNRLRQIEAERRRVP